MKRFAAILLALFLCIPLMLYASAAGEVRLYVNVLPSENGTFLAEIRWEGMTEEDQLSALRFSLAYPSDQVTCQSIGYGEAFRQFGVKMGPQNKEANPLTFVCVKIDGAAVEEGVLASLVFAPKEGEGGTVALNLNLIEAIRLDNSDCRDIFTVSGAAFSTDSAEADCAVTGEHTPGEWVQAPGEPGVLVRSCVFCKTELERKTAEPSAEPIRDGEAVLSPDAAGFPTDTALSVEELERELSDEELSESESAFATPGLQALEALEVTLSWNGDRLCLEEGGMLTVPAPEGVADGETVYIMVETVSGEKQYGTATCRDGKITFPLSVSGTVWILREAPGDDPADPAAPTPAPAEPQTGDKTLLQEYWWCALLVLVLAAGVTVFFSCKKKHPAEDGEPEDEQKEDDPS